MSLVKLRNNGLQPMSSRLTEMLDLDRFFDSDSFFRGFKKVPSANIKEKDNRFEVELAAPGMQKEDFKVELDNDMLVISAEKENKHEDRDSKGDYTRREFSYQSFVRTFSLPERLVKGDKIVARYHEGILSISIPKTEEAKTKQVKQIQIS